MRSESQIHNCCQEELETLAAFVATWTHWCRTGPRLVLLSYSFDSQKRMDCKFSLRFCLLLMTAMSTILETLL